MTHPELSALLASVRPYRSIINQGELPMSAAKPKAPKSILVKVPPMVRVEPHKVDLPIVITPKFMFQGPGGGEPVEIPTQFIEEVK